MTEATFRGLKNRKCGFCSLSPNVNTVNTTTKTEVNKSKSAYCHNSMDGKRMIRGSVYTTWFDYNLIETFLRASDKDIEQIIPMFKLKNSNSTSYM